MKSARLPAARVREVIVREVGVMGGNWWEPMVTKWWEPVVTKLTVIVEKTGSDQSPMGATKLSSWLSFGLHL